MSEIMNINIPIPDKMHFEVNGKTYEVILLISLLDVYEISNVNVEDVYSCIEYIRHLIHRHIRPETMDLVISDISIEICDQYISAMLRSDDDLVPIYDKYPDEIDYRIRFVKTVIEHNNQLRDRFANETMPMISETIISMQKAYQEILKPIVNSIQNFHEQYKDLFSAMAKQISEFAETFSSIQIPSLTEEDKERILNKYRTWGDYGWTSTEFLEENLIDIEPQDIVTANQVAKVLFNRKSIDALFNEMQSIDSIKKSDLIELQKSFFEHNYKACVLIAFGMIDSKVIRSQDDANRKIGNKGIDRLKKKLMDNQEYGFLMVSFMVNLFQCLKKMFEDSANFAVQPTVINRHFVSHGMLHRKVTKRDALQVILVTYNLYYTTEIIEAISKEL